MKKLTMSVAALTIAISGFTTNLDSTQIANNNLVKEIVMTTEDIILSMRINNYNDATRTRQLSEMYIVNLLDVLSKLEDFSNDMKKELEEQWKDFESFIQLINLNQ